MSQGAPRHRPRSGRSDGPRPEAARPDGSRTEATRPPQPDGARTDAPRGTRSPPKDGGSNPRGRRRRRVGVDGPRPTEGGPSLAPTPAPLPPTAASTPPGQALERLRARVLDTVRELERLRTENDTLAARVADLEAESGRIPAPAAPFDGDPLALRRQIEGFVAALDALLTDEDAATPPA